MLLTFSFELVPEGVVVLLQTAHDCLLAVDFSSNDAQMGQFDLLLSETQSFESLASFRFDCVTFLWRGVTGRRWRSLRN